MLSIFWSKCLFFAVHLLIHFFGYSIPRFILLFFRVITLKPVQKDKNNYIDRPEDQVQVIHNKEETEVVEEVFGLVDVKASVKEDKQYCCATDEERRALMAKAKEQLLFYDRPFYNAHVSTIMGIKRPTTEVKYAREITLSWDGCPIALDWLYVDGVPPVCSGCSPQPSPPPESHSEESPSQERELLTNLMEKAEDQPQAHESSGLTLFPHMPHFPKFFSSSSSDRTDDSKSEPPSTPHRETETESPTTRPFMTTPVKGVVLLIPGLSSSSQTSYVRRFVTALHDQKYHVCVINTRGFGGVAPSTPFILNSAYTRDFRTVVQRLFRKEAITKRFGYPLPVIGLGLSNGGATLSKYLGEAGRDGEEPILDAAITSHAPNDFVNVVEHMNRGTMQKLIYQPDMCNDIRQYIFSHEELTRVPNIDREYVFTQGNINRFTRVIHFDEHIFSKTSGYRSIHQYHIDASPVLWLPYTPIPTMVLASFDDPVIGRTVMPHRWKEMCANNPRLVSVEVRQGGHIGFLQGPMDELLDRPDWLHRFVIQRMDAVSQYWRSVQQHPEKSSGIMQIIPESWDRYYQDTDHIKEEEVPLASPTYSVNTLYFTQRTTKKIPKAYLYRSYFNTPQEAERSSEEKAKKWSVSSFSDLKGLSASSMESAHPFPSEVVVMESFNEKARPISEVLRTAARAPVLTNCDYYVDPRVYMVSTPDEV